MIDQLLDEAFRLFEEAEMKVDISSSESIALFRKAVFNLLSAYLLIQGTECEGGFAELYRQCFNINSEFESIHYEVDYLINAVPEAVDGEELTDYANEIWDFMQGLLGESETEPF
ncbi:MAG: hypothetical protein GXY86_00460 [Firmicutes bacterium]|nr:hypothetical protein [Bacillota bacterium]